MGVGRGWDGDGERGEEREKDEMGIRTGMRRGWDGGRGKDEMGWDGERG